jgi:translocation and assembly module TamB
MRWLAHITMLLMLFALPAAAQDDSDASFLERQLQNLLSGEGRDVRIEGFRGALSSAATIERITFADRDGVWLSIDQVQMNWNRAALLRGAIRINELTAQEITLSRPPLPAASTPPDAGAGGFALPDLPVSVEIGRLDARRVSLGEPVIGLAAELTVTGDVALISQTAVIGLRIDRLDGPQGFIAVSANFNQAEDLLALEIVAREDPGGIVAALTKLPGAPAIDLTIGSDGPLSDFVADIALATDGVPRITGTVALRQQADPDAPDDPAGWRLTAGLQGDAAALVADRYRPFFGDLTLVSVDALRAADGRLTLDEATVKTAGFYLDAAGAIGADGYPEALLVRGLLRDTRGGAGSTARRRPADMDRPGVAAA